jgi:hypothetical protein
MTALVHCAAGYFFEASAGHCSLCPLGTYSEAGHSSVCSVPLGRLVSFVLLFGVLSLSYASSQSLLTINSRQHASTLQWQIKQFVIQVVEFVVTEIADGLLCLCF